MDPASQSPDKSDVKPSFHKPSHDAANRKYRRHTPVGGSDSSSSGGSPNRRSHSPVYSDDRQRKDDGREVERDSNYNRSSRGSDSHRHSDRQSYGASHDYARNTDRSRNHRLADVEDRSYHRSSRTGRESRSGARTDLTLHDSNSDRSRETWRSGDKYSREKTEGVGHGSKDKDHRHNVKDSDRAASGSRQIDSSRDDIKTGERDRHRDRETRDERRDRHRSPGDYKNDHGSSREKLREHARDSTLGRDSGSTRLKETLWSGNTEIDVPKEKRKHDDRESDKRKEKYTREAEAEMKNESSSLSRYRERDERNERFLDKTVKLSEEQSSSKKRKLRHSEGLLFSKSIANAVDEKLSSSSKQFEETAERVTSEPVSAPLNQTETAQDLNAAKVAAMKAAELVNRNLVGGSCLSTDQKKKLLWGNKKNTSTEETGNRWDLQLFPDRERQEKFNKLMGVKGDAIPERRPDDKDGNLCAEKQEKLQMDLEKQYTAGLRRRDGRTVGLGL